MCSEIFKNVFGKIQRKKPDIEKEGKEVRWASHYYIYFIINIMLVDFHHLFLFGFPLFLSFKFVINYFQFVKFTDLFQPSYSPLQDPAKLKYSV